MSDIKANPYSGSCPSRDLIAVIGDKWSLLIIPLLVNGRMRNSELLHAVDGISQKMLTQTLKQLEFYQLVQRTDYGEVPPRVDYQLTDLGRSLADILSPVDQWVVENFDKTRADPKSE
ncbi:MAG: helix-turn-helix domain-containing protein [Pseudomonadota bacterium]